MKFDVYTAGRRREIDATRTSAGWTISINGRPVPGDAVQIGRVWSLLIGDSATDAGSGADVGRPLQSFEVTVEELPNGELVVWVNGSPVKVFLGSPEVRAGARRFPRIRDAGGADRVDGPQRVTAPMPGKVVRVLVKPGDAVQARQGLVVVEAMKMENELRSPRAGTVAEVRVAVGTSVEAGAVLVVVE